MAAAPTGQPTGSSIEALFRPANRFRDLRGDIFSRILARYTEVELLPGLTVFMPYIYIYRSLGFELMFIPSCTSI
jgi:hypothetical protein